MIICSYISCVSGWSSVVVEVSVAFTGSKYNCAGTVKISFLLDSCMGHDVDNSNK